MLWVAQKIKLSVWERIEMKSADHAHPKKISALRLLWLYHWTVQFAESTFSHFLLPSTWLCPKEDKSLIANRHVDGADVAQRFCNVELGIRRSIFFSTRRLRHQKECFKGKAGQGSVNWRWWWSLEKLCTYRTLTIVVQSIEHLIRIRSLLVQ